jgi:hypothetical protein
MSEHSDHKRRPEDEDLKKWVVKISEDCEATVASILKIGHDLIEAKKELHRRFGLLFNDAPPFTDEVVPFDWRTGQRYMAIAAHPVLRDATHESHFPPCWTTLYVLSQIPERRLLELIRQGKVHSGMTRSDGERLVSKDAPKRRVSKAPKTQLRALEVMVEAMDEFDAEALADDLVQLVEDEDKACGVLERLPEVAQFITELAEACEQAAIEKREARKAERKVAKGNGKELRPDCAQDA